MKTITHFLFSFGILYTSFSVICLGDSPVLAIVLLIATFVLAAIYLILLGISFIGITYIILYVGAIAVLFLFVIMMLNLKDKDLIEPSSVSLNNGIYSFIVIFFLGYLINSLTLFSLNFKNLIALDYLGLKDWYFLKLTAVTRLYSSGSEYAEFKNNSNSSSVEEYGETLMQNYLELLDYLNYDFNLVQQLVKLDTFFSNTSWTGKFLWDSFSTSSLASDVKQTNDYIVLLDKIELFSLAETSNSSYPFLLNWLVGSADTDDTILETSAHLHSPDGVAEEAVRGNRQSILDQEEISTNTSHADIALLDLTQIETLGQDLYTYGAVLLISLSIILLLAMFATIIISKPNLKHP